ncbi:MAG: rod shape-determining protein MreC [Endomicrobium sp.]|jgi:rod shape-determining protein MreC|nr:rod shape-determining protein MreC [Endomicrobium sp.]
MFKKNKKNRKFVDILFVFIFSIGLLFLICRSNYYVKYIGNIVYKVVYSSYNIFDYSFNNIFNFIKYIDKIDKLQNENIFYKHRNIELVNKLYNCELINNKYYEIKKILDLKEKYKKEKIVFANVFIKNPHELYKYIIIDKGANDGLYKDLPVVYINKHDLSLFVVGKIFEVYKKSSKVILITNQKCVLSVEIKNKNINCLSNGLNSNLLKISYIPAEFDINKGDEIITSELSSVFKKGLKVGLIQKILKFKTENFKTAIVNVNFNINNIHDVIVFLPHD